MTKEKQIFHNNPADLIETSLDLDCDIENESLENELTKICLHIPFRVKQYKMWCMNRKITMSNAFRTMFKYVRNNKKILK
ncbi:hypothetical protein [Rickettsia endosymbiont of Cardiosporidium cionae]|uniref:hypothetical protein n=1 Tax=Rickettsia endosymbiont of Cardiosporidium cionae TaxID=2777155 RepID=UPI0018961B14|nr:hypothetical protein [Rickettsia endosymbiont of Cardiosporidium cionae]KAF8818054.1 hypothetical protein IHI24_000902 [Rickettsia endosymbiont of Cardiosporidium cionae]